MSTDGTVAPIVASLKLDPNAILKRHCHPDAIKAVCVLDGKMFNDGVRQPRGSIVKHGRGTQPRSSPPRSAPSPRQATDAGRSARTSPNTDARRPIHHPPSHSSILGKIQVA